MKKIFAISKSLILRVWHDKRTLFLIFFVPAFVMFVFGYSTGQIKNLKVFVINKDEGNLAKRIVENLDKEILNLKEEIDEEKAKNEIKQKRAFGAIVFEKDFSQSLILKKKAKIKLILDATLPEISAEIFKNLQKSIEKTTEGKIEFEKEFIFGKEGMRFIDFFAPGMIAMSSMFLSFGLTIISFVKEKISGTFERILACPISNFKIVLGYLVAFLPINFVQSLILLSVAILAFNVYLKGNLILVLFVIFLNSLVYQSLGLLFSSFAQSLHQASQFQMLILIPMLLVSGVLWPIESMPNLMQKISDFIPLKYSTSALRDVMIRGFGISQISKEISILFAFSFLFLFFAFFVVRQRR